MPIATSGREYYTDAKLLGQATATEYTNTGRATLVTYTSGLTLVINDPNGNTIETDLVKAGAGAKIYPYGRGFTFTFASSGTSVYELF